MGADLDLAAAVLARPRDLSPGLRRWRGRRPALDRCLGLPGRFIAKTAKQCTPAEVAAEVWQQLKAALDGSHAGETILSDDLLHSWHLDEDLDYATTPPAIRMRAATPYPSHQAPRTQTLARFMLTRSA